MKAIFALIFFIIFSITSLCNAKTKEYCENKWPGNYLMIEHCIDSQRGDCLKFATYVEDYGGNKDAKKIIDECLFKWELPAFDTFNFIMVTHCIEEQFNSYASLYGPLQKKKPEEVEKKDIQKNAGPVKSQEALNKTVKKNDEYMETKSKLSKKYKIDETIELQNTEDDVISIYKDSGMENIIIMFTNGVHAKIIEVGDGKYKVKIGNYTGWIPEGVIKQ